MRVVDMPES